MNNIVRLFLLIGVFLLNFSYGASFDSNGNIISYEFKVENFTMVEAYYNIFNAIASIFSGGDYMSLLKMVFLLGGFFVFLNGVLKSIGGSPTTPIKEFTSYMLTGVVLLTLIFSHKSTMVLKTDNYPGWCTSSQKYVMTANVIDNIPTILAWTFETVNLLGQKLTELATESYSKIDTKVNNINKSDYISYLLGISQIQSLSLDSIQGNLDSDFKVEKDNVDNLGSALRNIVLDCIYLPASTDSTYGPQIINALRTTGDTKKTISDLLEVEEEDNNGGGGAGSNNNNGATINSYKNPTCSFTAALNCKNMTEVKHVILGGIAPKDFTTTLNGETYTCQNAWQKLDKALVSLKNSGKVECTDSLRDFLTPATIAILTGDPSLATIPQGRDIALNSAMANQLLDSKNDIAMGELSYAAGKSMSEKVTSSLAAGSYMAEMLPYLQMGMRAVLYAFFPFIFVVILLPGGLKVLTSYLRTLVWIELWSPTAAILNMFLSKMSEADFKNMYASQGYNPLNGVQTLTDAAMLASVGGYLYASIPAITWLILDGSAKMLSGLGSNLALEMQINQGSEQINQDLADRTKTHKVNEVRQSRGEKMISMAEMDKLESNTKGLSEAGKWTANTDHMDDQFMASFGKTSKNIASNTGIANSYLTNSNAYVAEKSKSKVDTKIITKTQEDLDNITKDGKENKENIDNNAEGESNKKAIEQKKNMKAVKFQKMIAKSLSGKEEVTLKESQDTIARVQSISDMDKLNKEGQYQELIHKTDKDFGTKNERSRFETNITASNVEAADKTFESNKKEQELIRTDILNNDKSPRGFVDRLNSNSIDSDSVNLNRLTDITDSIGKINASELIAQNDTQKAVTFNEMVQSETYSKIEKISQSLSLNNTAAIQLESYINNADLTKEEKDKANLLLDKIKNGTEQEKNRALYDITSKLAPIGQAGKMAQSIESDSNTNALNNNQNIKTSELGDFKANEIKNKYITARNRFKILSQDKKGLEALNLKEGETIDTLTDNEIYQKSSLAMTKMSVDSKIYQTIKNKELVTDLTNSGFSATRVAKAEEWKQRVDTSTVEIKKSLFNNEYVNNEETGVKFFAAIKLLSDISSIGELWDKDFGKKRKKTNTEKRKMRNAKRIKELKKQSVLNEKEKKELRRLLDEQERIKAGKTIEEIEEENRQNKIKKDKEKLQKAEENLDKNTKKINEVEEEIKKINKDIDKKKQETQNINKDNDIKSLEDKKKKKEEFKEKVQSYVENDQKNIDKAKLSLKNNNADLTQEEHEAIKEEKRENKRIRDKNNNIERLKELKDKSNLTIEEREEELSLKKEIEKVKKIEFQEELNKLKLYRFFDNAQDVKGIMKSLINGAKGLGSFGSNFVGGTVGDIIDIASVAKTVVSNPYTATVAAIGGTVVLSVGDNMTTMKNNYKGARNLIMDSSKIMKKIKGGDTGVVGSFNLGKNENGVNEVVTVERVKANEYNFIVNGNKVKMEQLSDKDFQKGGTFDFTRNNHTSAGSYVVEDFKEVFQEFNNHKDINSLEAQEAIKKQLDQAVNKADFLNNGILKSSFVADTSFFVKETVDNIKNISQEDIENEYHDIVNKASGFIKEVSEITKEDIKEKVEEKINDIGEEVKEIKETVSSAYDILSEVVVPIAVDKIKDTDTFKSAEEFWDNTFSDKEEKTVSEVKKDTNTTNTTVNEVKVEKSVPKVNKTYNEISKDFKEIDKEQFSKEILGHTDINVKNDSNKEDNDTLKTIAKNIGESVEETIEDTKNFFKNLW